MVFIFRYTVSFLEGLEVDVLDFKKKKKCINIPSTADRRPYVIHS